jgi:hypothetical protein
VETCGKEFMNTIQLAQFLGHSFFNVAVKVVRAIRKKIILVFIYIYIISIDSYTDLQLLSSTHISEKMHFWLRELNVWSLVVSKLE